MGRRPAGGPARAALACALLVAAYGCTAAAGISPAGALIETELSRREGAVLRLKAHVEALLASPNATAAMLASCADYASISESACASSLRDGRCMPHFGETSGCACAGRVLSTSSPVVLASRGRPGLAGREADQERENFATACLAHSMRSVFQREYVDFIEAGDVKWLYVGLDNGNLINFPGFLWPRGPGHADQPGCAAANPYSPLYRPWHLVRGAGEGTRRRTSARSDASESGR